MLVCYFSLMPTKCSLMATPQTHTVTGARPPPVPNLDRARKTKILERKKWTQSFVTL